MLDAPLVQSVEQDKPDEEKETRQQQTVLQQQSDVQPPSDAEVAVDTVWYIEDMKLIALAVCHFGLAFAAVIYLWKLTKCLQT